MLHSIIQTNNNQKKKHFIVQLLLRTRSMYISFVYYLYRDASLHVSIQTIILSRAFFSVFSATAALSEGGWLSGADFATPVIIDDIMSALFFWIITISAQLHHEQIWANGEIFATIFAITNLFQRRRTWIGSFVKIWRWAGPKSNSITATPTGMAAQHPSTTFKCDNKQIKRGQQTCGAIVPVYLQRSWIWTLGKRKWLQQQNNRSVSMKYAWNTILTDKYGKTSCHSDFYWQTFWSCEFCIHYCQPPYCINNTKHPRPNCYVKEEGLITFW